MALLFQLIKTLNDDEIKSIASGPMQDREREVLQAMCSINKKVFPSLSISKQLNLKTSHLDKINSILLKKSIETLAGENIYSQIAYLGTKTGQWNLSKHLLKSHEQKLLRQQDDQQEVLRFFKFCFEWMVSAPFSHQAIKDLNYFGERILEACSETEKAEQQLWIDIIFLRREINLAISKTTIRLSPIKETIIQRLHALQEQAGHLNSTQGIFRLGMLSITLHNLFQEFDKSLQIEQKLQELIKTNPGSFTAQDELIAGWYKGQIYFHSSRFAESYEHYKYLSAKTDPKQPVRWFMFYAEYLQSCLATNHIDTAGELVKDYFSKYGDDINGSLYISSSLQIIKYYLYNGEFEKAIRLIEAVKKIMQKTSLLQFQLAIKELHLAHAYLTGNGKLAVQLAEQNLKFMRFKQMHHTIPEYTYHSRLIKPIAKYKSNGHTLTEKELFMLHELQQGTRAQYGKLLMRWYDGK